MGNSSLAKLMKREYEKGVNAGWDAFALVSLIAGYNVADEVFVNDEQYFKFFKLWEEECVRIFAEDCHNNPEAALLLHDKTNMLRERMGLEIME